MSGRRRATGRAAARRVSRRRRVVFVALAAMLAGSMIEIGARIVLAVHHRNPYYLTYGLVPDVERQSAEHEGYATFQPGVVKRQRRGDGTMIRMRINNRGFRDRRDFGPKPAGVVRVAALGASSTFGYHVEDEETYPAALERALAARWPDREVEVLNLGIPHARLDNIVALAAAELPCLQPDIVVLYAGYNNAMLPRARAASSAAYRAKDWLLHHVVAWRFVHGAVKALYFGAVAATQHDVVAVPNRTVPLRLGPAEIEAAVAAARAELEADLARLDSVVGRLGARLVLVAQYYQAPMPGLGYLSYADDVSRLRHKLDDDGALLAIEAVKLVHAALVEAQRRFARERGLLFVEAAAALGERPAPMMRSLVHLSPAGNARVAAEIADALSAVPAPMPGLAAPEPFAAGGRSCW